MHPSKVALCFIISFATLFIFIRSDYDYYYADDSYDYDSYDDEPDDNESKGDFNSTFIWKLIKDFHQLTGCSSIKFNIGLEEIDESTRASVATTDQNTAVLNSEYSLQELQEMKKNQRLQERHEVDAEYNKALLNLNCETLACDACIMISEEYGAFALSTDNAFDDHHPFCESSIVMKKYNLAAQSFCEHYFGSETVIKQIKALNYSLQDHMFAGTMRFNISTMRGMIQKACIGVKACQRESFKFGFRFPPDILTALYSDASISKRCLVCQVVAMSLEGYSALGMHMSVAKDVEIVKGICDRTPGLTLDHYDECTSMVTNLAEEMAWIMNLHRTDLRRKAKKKWGRYFYESLCQEIKVCEKKPKKVAKEEEQEVRLEFY